MEYNNFAIFDQHVANDTRQHHSYYRTLIGTRIWSVEWCNFQWPRV